MACLFIPVFSESFIAFSTEKTLLSLEYSTEISIEALSNSKAPTWACFLECTGISSYFWMATYTINVSLLISNVAITIFFN